MEAAPRVPRDDLLLPVFVASFADAQQTEILGGFRDYIIVQLEFDSTSGLAVNSYIELKIGCIFKLLQIKRHFCTKV